MDKKYYLKVDGKCIPVTEKVYRTYQQPKWKEKKQAEVRIKKEVSLDLMMETGSFIQPHLGQALVEDIIMEKLLLDELHVALMQLTNDERLKVRGRNIQKMCREISDKLTIFTSPDNLICWIESQKTCYKLCAIPKQLNKILAEDIWRKRIPYILTSGTISADNSFDLLKRKTGIEMMFQKQIIEVSKKSMFDYKNNTLMYIPESMPFPNMQEQEYTLAIINEIDKLIKLTYGHALILFTSYRLMDKVFSEVSHRKYDFPLFLMGKGRIDVLSNFKISGNGVLFASDTAGEGIDIVGDALSNLIIVKLPFAVPDPISEYEQSEIGGLQEYLDKINTPNMIIKLKQYEH